MRLNTLAGTIERRLLINYRVEPEAIKRVLPSPFEPALVGGYAIAGICLIELRVRPTWLPGRIGFRSLNGAHRIAIILPDGSDAVYVPRRDTNSRLSAVIGGRIFPGKQHYAAFEVHDAKDRVTIELTSRDASTHVAVTASTTERLPEASVFGSVQQVSDFFERGSLGYSDSPHGDHFDGLELQRPTGLSRRLPWNTSSRLSSTTGQCFPPVQPKSTTHSSCATFTTHGIGDRGSPSSETSRRAARDGLISASFRLPKQLR